MRRDGSVVPLIRAGSDGEGSLVPTGPELESLYNSLANLNHASMVIAESDVPESSLPRRSQKLDALVSAARQIASRVRNT
jgi:hypothetical protein